MKKDLPPFRYIFGHLAVGVASGWLVLGGILLLDIGGVGTLLAASPARVLLFSMLLAVFAITWGSAAMGAAIMAIGNDDAPAGGHPEHAPDQFARATQIVAPSGP